MTAISLSTLAAFIAFSITLLSTGFVKLLSFGLFWLFLLALLISVMSKKRWDASVWLAFSTFSASVIVGVLFSLGYVVDQVLVGVVLLGLLFVNMVVNVLATPSRTRSSTPPRPPQKKTVHGLNVAILSTGNKYHQPTCRLLKNKKFSLVPVAKAHSEGLAPCGVCKPKA